MCSIVIVCAHKYTKVFRVPGFRSCHIWLFTYNIGDCRYSQLRLASCDLFPPHAFECSLSIIHAAYGEAYTRTDIRHSADIGSPLPTDILDFICHWPGCKTALLCGGGGGVGIVQAHTTIRPYHGYYDWPGTCAPDGQPSG